MNAYQKKLKFHEHYLEKDFTTISEQFEYAIEVSIVASIKYEVYNKFVKKTTTIEHWCYECRSPIDVDVSTLLKTGEQDVQEYLCDKHKQHVNISKHSLPFIKYENILFKKLQKLLMNIPILENSISCYQEQ